MPLTNPRSPRAVHNYLPYCPLSVLILHDIPRHLLPYFCVFRPVFTAVDYRVSLARLAHMYFLPVCVSVSISVCVLVGSGGFLTLLLSMSLRDENCTSNFLTGGWTLSSVCSSRHAAVDECDYNGNVMISQCRILLL